MRQQSNKLINIIFISTLVILIAGVVFVFFSPQFERNNPTITFKNNNYWNAKDKLSFSFNDESGIRFYRVVYKSSNKEIEILSKKVDSKEKTIDIEIEPFDIYFMDKDVKLLVEVYDNSMWNFFGGNITKEEFELIIDKKSPRTDVLINSRYLRRGGAGTVVVKVSDENLKDKYITFNNETRFELIPFLKDDYYAATFAWPIDVEFEDFQIVNLVAIDKANNKSVTKIPVYIQDLKIKNDKLKISDNFINNISKPVLEKSNENIPNDNVEIFIAQNRDLRAKNVSKIRSISLDNMSRDQINHFSLNRFKRLSGSKTFAGFAERREYFYEGESIDKAWHLGMDWASVIRADVKVSNPGKVIFDGYLGIYGNTMIIDHGLGIQSLYAHTSNMNFQKGDEVKRNEKIANTGSTGAVFGDHLHFGILIQGVEVNPLEWMDSNWIKTRVLDILEEAKKEISSSK